MTTQTADQLETKKFYCTMIRDTRVAWLLGPYDTLEDAEAHVREAREAAYAIDPRSHWDAFGVTGVTAGSHPPGVITRHRQQQSNLSAK